MDLLQLTGDTAAVQYSTWITLAAQGLRFESKTVLIMAGGTTTVMG